MKKKIYNIIMALAALFLLGEEGYEHFGPTADRTPEIIPASYSVPPTFELPAADAVAAGAELNEELADTERSVPRYWLAQITYSITDNVIGSDAVPGGQEYTYLYTYPTRVPFFQHEQPRVEDVQYIPRAIKALGMSGMAQPVHVHSIPIR